MNTTLKVGVGSAALAIGIYATGMLISGALTFFGLLVMVPLAVGSFCIFGNYAQEGLSKVSEKTKEKLAERKEKKDLDSLKTQTA